MALGDKQVKLLITADGRQAEGELNRLGSSLKGFGGLAGAALGVGALAKLSTDLLTVNTEYQRMGASLKTLTGSSQGAASAFAMLSKFATETPYQISDVVGAFTKLKAMGLDPSEDALRSYGNTASAMGKDLNMMVEAVADAAVGEFERLKEFGIKAKSEGDNVSFTFQGVTTTVKKNSAEIEGYLRKIGDTNFAGAMTEQMKTLGGATSNLKDSYDGLLRSMGDAGLNDAAINSINALSAALQRMTTLMTHAGQEFTATTEWAAALSMGDISVWEWMTTGADEAAVKLKALRQAQAKANDETGWDDTGPRSHEAVVTRSTSSSGAGLGKGVATSPLSDFSREYLEGKQEIFAAEMELYDARLAMNKFATNEIVVQQREELGALAEARALAQQEELVKTEEQKRRLLEIEQAYNAQVMSITRGGAGDFRTVMGQMYEWSSGASKTEADGKVKNAADATAGIITTANALASFSDASSKKSFERQKAVGIATATVAALANAIKAANETEGAPWYVRAAIIAAALAQGMAIVSQIKSTQYGGASSAVSTTGGLQYSNAGGGPVLQPSGGSQENGRSITVNIQGNIIGEDKWVEESFVPALRRLADRNVLVMA